mgnify:CR=1 FL=1
MEKRSYYVTGMSFAGVLTIIFVVLRLLHVIEWHWLLVLSPLLISLAIQVLLFAGVILFVLVRTFGRKAK